FAGLIFPVPVMVKLFGSYWTLVGLGAAYVVATALVSFLPKDQAPLTTREAGNFLSRLWTELKEGWQHIRSSPIISFSMLHMTTATTLILILSVIASPYVKRVLGIRADDAVYILAPAGIGVALGVILAPRLASRIPRPRLINVGMVAMAVCLMAFGSANGVGRYLAGGLPEQFVLQWLLAVVILLAFFMGLAFAFITIPAQTILQERTPISLRGKVLATQLTMGNVATIFPIIFVGGLADLFGIAQIIILTGLVVLCIGLFSLRHYRWMFATAG
ncbi:MAG: MFS transporter, partial [Dehalococcoidia bacterium]|nr:MFS transporter [Dehalococcoidia bacterium]